MAYNNLAWLYATCPDEKYRNGIKAIALAKKAAELDAGHTVLATLAAAHAETGNFKEAIAAQEKAISLLKKSNDKEELVEQQKRLESYKLHKPWRKKKKR